MKIKRRVHESGNIELTFFDNNEKYIASPIFLKEEIVNFATNGSVTAVDGYYTARKSYTEFYLYRETQCPVYFRCYQLNHLFDIILNIDPKINLILNTDSFNKPKDRLKYMGWHEIGKSPYLYPACKKIIIEAYKRNLGESLKPILSRYLQWNSGIFPDFAKLSFSFNGRREDGYPNGCGYNGGIIYHEYSKSYSVHT